MWSLSLQYAVTLTFLNQSSGPNVLSLPPLLQAVLSFSLPPPAVAAHVAALHKLSQTGPKEEDVKREPQPWCKNVIDAAHDLLTKFIENSGGGTAAVRGVVWMLIMPSNDLAYSGCASPCGETPCPVRTCHGASTASTMP